MEELRSSAYERQHGRRELLETITQFATVFEAFPDILLKVDRQGNILYVKCGKNAAINLSEQNLQGRNLSSVFPVDVLRSIQRAVDSLNSENTRADTEFKIYTLGKTVWFEARVMTAHDHEIIIILRDISPRKEAEYAGKLSENKFKAIFDHTFQHMGLLKPDGTVLEINKAMLDFGGLESKDVAGLPFWVAPWWAYSDTAREMLKDAVSRAAKGEFIRYETEICGTGGKLITVDFSLKPILNDNNEVILLIPEGRDVTQARKAESQIRQSEKFYRSLAQNLPTGIILMFDEDYRYILAEGKELAQLGFDREKLIGKQVFEVLPEPYLDEVLGYYQEALKGNTATFEISTNNSRCFLCTAMPAKDAEGRNCGMIIGFDIDVMKETQKELEQRISQMDELNQRLRSEISLREKIERNLKEYADELKSKNEELEQFAYVASHDLQEPLRMVSSFAQLLSARYAGKIDPDATDFVNYITEGATRMQRLINGLLLYSRIGRKEREKDLVDLNSILMFVKQNLSVPIRENGVTVQSGRLPEVCADEDQIIQLLQNLLSNAIKFSNKERAIVISVDAEEKEDYWQIHVKDNGIGIENEHKDRIFKIFQRLHTQSQFPGTGIGLAICKRIVEKHGGDIWVESVPGEGSAFYFTIAK